MIDEENARKENWKKRKRLKQRQTDKLLRVAQHRQEKARVKLLVQQQKVKLRMVT